MMPALWDDGVEAIDVAPVHWGTSTILSIFFAACLVSALFFGLGYSFGTHGTGQPGMAQQPGMAWLGTAWPGPGHTKNGEVSAGARPSQSVSGSVTPMKRAVRHPVGSRSSHRVPAVSVTPKVAVVNSDIHRVAQPVLRPVSAFAAAVPATTRRKPFLQAAVATHSSTRVGQARTMVQVSAIRSRRDARILVSQLRKKGFDARVYAGKHDPYLHVQIGPFSSISQAQAMRRRVMSSGYRAVLK